MPTPPIADRAGAEVLDRDASPLVKSLRELFTAGQVLCATSELVSYSADASPYRMVPSVVVRPRDVADVQQLMRWASASGHSLTMRAGGTSLNGQSQTDDVLVDMRHHFRSARVLDGGQRLQSEPGVVLARANLLLARHGTVLGPDPASAGAATIGGVLANNASGMTCGVVANAYRTLESASIVLASGTVLDTGDPDADALLADTEPSLVAELIAVRDELRADRVLADRIRRKFSIKNTSGYRLDAFLDAERPADIVTKLVVGSEGTLGVVVDSRWCTLPIGRWRSTGFLRFPDARSAASVVAALNAAHAQAVEFMDAVSLRSIRGRHGTPGWINELADDATDAAILVERRAASEPELDAFDAEVEQILAGFLTRSATQPLLTRDATVAASYWRLRSGLLPSIGASRPAGTSLITEDVVVPPERLPEAVADLQQILVRHGMSGAVNGHASAGNLHFYLYLDATDPASVENYRRCMVELVDLVVDDYDGSLKGEHGAGRNMAPFLTREWGEQAMRLMWRVKRAFDPRGILAPGVFLNEDAEAPFRHLKSMPGVDAALDPCIECGFCEPVCPSRDVTTTPRQRIVLQRELARQGHRGPVADRLVDEYAHDAVDTCAGDGSCAIACPVDIDTGAAMKRLRVASHPPPVQSVGVLVAHGWKWAERVARLALRLASVVRPVIGDRGLAALLSGPRLLLGDDVVPTWLPELPGAAARLPQTPRMAAEAVYFPACINRIFGPPTDAADTTTLPEALVALSRRAGHPVWIPPDVAGQCCATVWHSKGWAHGNEVMARSVADAVWRWSEHGRLLVVVDASSCTLGLVDEIVPFLDAPRRDRHARVRIIDALTWTTQVLIPDLPGHARNSLAVVHPTCSMHHLGVVDDLVAVAGEVAQEVYVPPVATCCGFAGDRGLLHPELTESATADEAALVADRVADSGATGARDTISFVSGNRTCELGLQHATRQPYESAIVALERLSR